jgi:hypothetical protein
VQRQQRTCAHSAAMEDAGGPASAPARKWPSKCLHQKFLPDTPLLDVQDWPPDATAVAVGADIVVPLCADPPYVDLVRMTPTERRRLRAELLARRRRRRLPRRGAPAQDGIGGGVGDPHRSNQHIQKEAEEDEDEEAEGEEEEVDDAEDADGAEDAASDISDPGSAGGHAPAGLFSGASWSIAPQASPLPADEVSAAEGLVRSAFAPTRPESHVLGASITNPEHHLHASCLSGVQRPQTRLPRQQVQQKQEQQQQQEEHQTLMDKKQARIIRNREVALRARQAAKDKLSKLQSENGALQSTASCLESQNLILKNQIQALQDSFDLERRAAVMP